MAKYKDLTSNVNDIKHTPFEGDRLMGGASEYIGPNPSEAGAGRGKQGGPTAGELKAKELDDIREANLKHSAKKKGVSVEQLRKSMSDEYDKKMKDGEFYKRGGKVKKMASGGMTSKVSSASSRADGCCTKGKTRGKMY